MDSKFGLSSEAWAYVRDGGDEAARGVAMDEVGRMRDRGRYMEGGSRTGEQQAGQAGADEQEQESRGEQEVVSR